METIMSMPITGIVICVGAYATGMAANRKTGWPIANPLLVAIIFVLLLIRAGFITADEFQSCGPYITMFIVPATTVLALQVSRQWELLKRNIFPVAAGCLAGSAASVASVWLMCRFFSLDEVITASLLPKSVTTAIAMDLAGKSGGDVALAVSAVTVTGITSSVVSPWLVKAFRLKDSAAAGTAFGVSGHALATAKAIQIGETEGAMSGIALSLSGIFTSLLYVLY